MIILALKTKNQHFILPPDFGVGVTILLSGWSWGVGPVIRCGEGTHSPQGLPGSNMSQTGQPHISLTPVDAIKNLVPRNVALMSASLWEPAPPVGLLMGDNRSGEKDFGFGWQGREWGASRPEALLRRVQKGPDGQQGGPKRGKRVQEGGPGKGGVAEKLLRAQSAQAIEGFREEERSGWKTHQEAKGSRKEEVSNRSTLGAGKGMASSVTLVPRPAAGLEGYLSPILANRRGQTKVFGSKVVANRSPSQNRSLRIKPKRKETGSSEEKYIPCPDVQKIWTSCFWPRYPRPSESSSSLPPKIGKRRGELYRNHHHKNPPQDSRGRRRGQSIFLPKMPKQRLPGKKPPWPFGTGVNTVKGHEKIKSNQQNTNSHKTFSLSFDPTLSTQKQQKIRSEAQPSIPGSHQTNSHFAQISNFSRAAHRPSRVRKSYDRKISPLLTLKTKKVDSDSSLPLAPNPRLPQSSSQQTLRRRQWQLPARTTQGWVNIKPTFKKILPFIYLRDLCQ